MPAAMTFTSLQEDLRRYLERGYTTDTQVFEQLPRLITLAERSIARALKIQGFVVPVTSTLSAGVSVYAKPNRWRDTVSMNFGTGEDQNDRKVILPRSYEYCRNYWPNSDLRDLPLFYSDYDYQHWLIVPTPVIDYPWEVMYYQQPPLLDDVTQTNWLTEYAPNALLYRALVEATPFLKNDERIAVWQNLYQAEMQALQAEDLQKVVDRAAVRNED
jgi:hypothetical protein